jgi:hypothetical protein
VVEILNESFVILTVYIIHGFSFFITNRNVRYHIGWVYIGVVGVVFVLNFAFIVQRVVLTIISKIKKFKTYGQKMKGQNVLARFFSWQSSKKGLDQKRKIPENTVVPLTMIDS